MAITDIEDVKCNGNWMGASKLEGEGAAMYGCYVAMGRLTVDSDSCEQRRRWAKRW